MITRVRPAVRCCAWVGVGVRVAETRCARVGAAVVVVVLVSRVVVCVRNAALERVRGSGRVGCDQLQYVVNTQNAEFLETSGFDDDVCPSWRRRSLKSEMVDFDLPALR